MSSRRWAVPILLGALVAVAGCEVASSAPFAYPAFTVTRLVPTGWMTGTRVEVEVEGLVLPPVATYALEVEVEGRRFAFPMTVDDARLVADVDADWFSAFEKPWELRTATVVIHRVIGEVDEPDGEQEVVLNYLPNPRLISIDQGSPVYPGDVVPMLAVDLFRPEENVENVLMVRGTRSFEAGTIPPWMGDWGGVASLEVGGPTGRLASAVRASPDLLGVRPGSFAGDAYIYVWHPGEFLGTWSEPISYRATVLPPVLDDVAPTSIARGRVLTASGRGLLPLDDDAGTASVLIFDGVFTPRRGAAEVHRGADAWVVPVEDVAGNTVGWAPLRTSFDTDGGLAGLGARAGRFEGTVALRVAAGADVVASGAVPVAIDVALPRQEVELRILPGFDDALEAFGLTAERDAVLARILAVVTRDYAGLNIGFGYRAPDGYAEWSVVELTGDDPNGTHLFGLDATTGKDAGNLRLDDVIGGFDPETRARGLAAYGGIFAAELLNLSPSLSTNPLASPRFDDVFGGVAPALGGVPAAPGEADRGDARAAAIREAVRVLGNLVGSTITHEVGHTLGLAAIDGRLHNDGDNPGWIMDAGIYRPFEERAELDGAGPAVFSPPNRAYLEQILPLEPPPEE